MKKRGITSMWISIVVVVIFVILFLVALKNNLLPILNID